MQNAGRFAIGLALVWLLAIVAWATCATIFKKKEDLVFLRKRFWIAATAGVALYVVAIVCVVVGEKIEDVPLT